MHRQRTCSPKALCQPCFVWVPQIKQYNCYYADTCRPASLLVSHLPPLPPRSCTAVRCGLSRIPHFPSFMPAGQTRSSLPDRPPTNLRSGYWVCAILVSGFESLVTQILPGRPRRMTVQVHPCRHRIFRARGFRRRVRRLSRLSGGLNPPGRCLEG